MEFLTSMKNNPGRARIALRAVITIAVIANLLLAASAFAQGRAREGLLAVETRVAAVKPDLIKATVAVLRAGGSGSGVIISPDGYVLTAAHVIAGGRTRTCYILLSDGRRLSATILGSNKEDDYGLVKIDAPDKLPVAPLGDSSTLHRGQWVLATGHPLGPKQSRPPVLRIGRVLFLPRDPDSRETNSIVSDAPIISGDSGGPLYDLNGRVVGINSMILAGDRRMSSIHVPINLAKATFDALKKGETLTNSDAANTPFGASLQEAQDALRAGDQDVAVRVALHTVELDPTSAKAELVLARAYARKAKPAQSLAALEKACDLGFNDVEALRRENDLSTLTDHPGMKKLLERLSAVNAIPGSRKGDMSLLIALGSMEPNLDRGVVRLESEDTVVALGTVMSADGDILTKASELPEGALTCVLPDGHKTAVERRGVAGEWDVALLKVKTTGLKLLPFAEISTVGKWTFSPDAIGGVAALGMVSVTDFHVRDKGIQSKPTSKAYLGVQLDPVPRDVLNKLGVNNGVAVIVEPGFPAAKAGLQTGDIIFEAEGQTVIDADTFMDFMVNKKPGDSISLRVVRDGDKFSVVVNLAERPANLPGRGGLLAQLSGDISRMQGPFPQVLQHDSVLKPSAMGGPLLDLDGKCIGLNIARADRAATYAIAAKDIKEIYARLKEKP